MTNRDSLKKLNAVWGENLSGQTNITLSFALDLEKERELAVDISAASCFKLYIDGRLVGFGPDRAAHGYARVRRYNAKGRYIIAEVHYVGVENFCWVKSAPFFACSVVSDGKIYSSEDFECRLLDDRVQKVQRYSYQRGFAEVYKVKGNRTDFAALSQNFKRIGIVPAVLPKLLGVYTATQKLGVHYPRKTIDGGSVFVKEKYDLWRDRAHTLIGTVLEGYKIEEWEESPTDEACSFGYSSGEKNDFGKVFETYDFGRSITGFAELKVKAEKGSSVYLIFDELIKENGDIIFCRNTTSNVFKWTFEKAGEYSVSSFEPYTLRYAKIVRDSGASVEVSVRDFENGETDGFAFSCADKSLESVVSAAKNTFAQNAADILTDCPSRERAGWLSDSWFSSVAERIFTGKNNAEKTFLENYLLCDERNFPEGLLPMCYPADVGTLYIPNWDMWYIEEIVKYADTHGVDDLVLKSREKVYSTFAYFEKKENEFGLLENLEGWVFIEWSKANDASHIAGVNVPSNICYAHCLKSAGRIYGDKTLTEKGENINRVLKEIAYNGEFFVDNLLRDQGGKLVMTDNLTEVCQYYAFWFGFADKKEYPALYEELMLRLGTERKEGYRPEIGEPNVMYGIYMRLDLLMRDGKRRKLLEEVRKIFTKMAETTGTLWEHNRASASCDHGFASYATRWIIYALTGYDTLYGEKAAEDGIGIDCKIVFPESACKYREITVENDRVLAE